MNGWPRFLLVGLDGACFSVVEAMFERGDVPTLRRLFEAGASGRLRSQIPPWTASAWPSMYTGTNPGKHGVYDFLSFEGYEWSIVDATCVEEPPLWKLLDHHGLSSVVLNVPVTHPSGEFDGALVPGYAAPENPTSRPHGVLEEIREACGGYQIYPDHTGETGPASDRVISEHVRLAEMRARAFSYLLDRVNPAFGFLQFQGTDSIVHELGGDRDAIRAVYRTIDRELATILDTYDPDTVMVVSDHGIGPYAGYEVRLNEVLRREGLVETVQGDWGMPTWSRIRDQNLTDGVADDDTSVGLSAQMMRILAQIGITSQRIGKVLDVLGLDETIARIAPTDAIRAGTEQVDFENSTAYVRSRLECGVRLNVEGREPDGVVPAEDYESKRQEIVDILTDMRTPDGDPVFETVALREEFYEGENTDTAVDVITVPNDFDHMLSTQVRNGVFDEPSEPWNHKRDGVVTVYGTRVPDTELSGAHLFDIAPTVLAMLDLPVGEHMDGQPLPVCDSYSVSQYPDRREPTTAVTHSGTVESRLDDLGYLQ